MEWFGPGTNPVCVPAPVPVSNDASRRGSDDRCENGETLVRFGGPFRYKSRVAWTSSGSDSGSAMTDRARPMLDRLEEEEEDGWGEGEEEGGAELYWPPVRAPGGDLGIFAICRAMVLNSRCLVPGAPGVRNTNPWT